MGGGDGATTAGGGGAQAPGGGRAAAARGGGAQEARGRGAREAGGRGAWPDPGGGAATEGGGGRARARGGRKAPAGGGGAPIGAGGAGEGARGRGSRPPRRGCEKALRRPAWRVRERRLAALGGEGGRRRVERHGLQARHGQGDGRRAEGRGARARHGEVDAAGASQGRAEAVGALPERLQGSAGGRAGVRSVPRDGSERGRRPAVDRIRGAHRRRARGVGRADGPQRQRVLLQRDDGPVVTAAPTRRVLPKSVPQAQAAACDGGGGHGGARHAEGARHVELDHRGPDADACAARGEDGGGGVGAAAVVAGGGRGGNDVDIASADDDDAALDEGNVREVRHLAARHGCARAADQPGEVGREALFHRDRDRQGHVDADAPALPHVHEPQRQLPGVRVLRIEACCRSQHAFRDLARPR